MLFAEHHGTCETTIGGTVITIESSSPENCKEDILDALVRLMKRDVAGVDTND